MKFTDKDLKTKSLIKSKEKKPCLICKQDTEYIDWCSEYRLCSTECEQKFYDLVREQETRFLNGEDIFNDIGVNPSPTSKKTDYSFEGYRPYEYFKTDNNKVCENCGCNPKNGGSGNCNCSLATPTIH